MKLINASEEVNPLEIIIDWNLYPRHEANTRIDYTNLRRITDAMEAGIVLPPIVITQDNRLTDGIHRYTGWVRTFGENTPIRVERYKYENETEMVLDAARRNTKHGLPLSPKDRVFLTLKLRKMKAPLAAIAEALGMSRENLEVLIKRRTATTSSGEKIAIGRGAEALSDDKRSSKHLSKNEETFARSSNGILPIINARLLLNALRALHPKDCPQHEFNILVELGSEIDRWELERGKKS
jgi:hypothetical protein